MGIKRFRCRICFSQQPISRTCRKMIGESRMSFVNWGIVSFLLLGGLWGGSFIAIDIVVATLPPLLLAGCRYAVAGVVVFGYAAVVTDRLLPRTAGELAVIVAAGLFTFAGYQAALFVGTQYVSGSVAAVVVSVSPVVAAGLGQAVLADESADPVDGLGFLLGVVGVTLVARPTTAGQTALGVVIVSLGAASFGVGAVATRAFDTGLAAATTQAWAMCLGSVVLLAGSLTTGESLPAVGHIAPDTLLAFGYVALCAGAVGYLLYFRLLETAGATETTLVSYLEPVGAVAVAALVVGESVRLATIGGFLVVCVGFAVIKRHSLRRVTARWRREWVTALMS